EVALGVDGAISRRVGRNDFLTEPPRRREPLAEERPVRRRPIEGPETREDLRARRIGAAGERHAVRTDDLREAVRPVSRARRDGAREEPGMSPTNRFFTARLQSEPDQSPSTR